MLGIHNLIRALQSSPFQNQGGERYGEGRTNGQKSLCLILDSVYFPEVKDMLISGYMVQGEHDKQTNGQPCVYYRISRDYRTGCLRKPGLKNITNSDFSEPWTPQTL